MELGNLLDSGNSFRDMDAARTLHNQLSKQ